MDASRHLHSVLHPFACLWVGLPWRTFTLSGHYSRAFGYYAASVLPSARWQFRAPGHGLRGMPGLWRAAHFLSVLRADPERCLDRVASVATFGSDGWQVELCPTADSHALKQQWRRWSALTSRLW
jgi:hypothetical protein